MVTKILVDVLRNDTTATAASALVAAYPTIFVNGVSSVPAYLCNPLSVLWGPSSLMIPDLGTGASKPSGSIVVNISKPAIEQVIDPGSLNADTPGAEISYVTVTFTGPQKTSIDHILNASLRVRYLLDQTIRSLRGSPGMPESSVFKDNTVDWRYPVLCFYQEATIEQIASQGEILFKVDYVRLFTR